MSGPNHHIVKWLRALSAIDWFGDPGELFREGLKSIAEKRDSTEVGSDGRVDEIERYSNIHDYEIEGQLSRFSDLEQEKISEELKRREREIALRQAESEARLKEIEVLEAEARLLSLLKAEKLSIYQDANGNMTVLSTRNTASGRDSEVTSADEHPNKKRPF